MTSDRRTALVAGACYFVTHVTSVAALALYAPVLDDPRFVLGAGRPGGVLLGAFLEVLLALTVVGTAVALFPVVRRHGEGLAIGYVALRTLEAGVIVVGVVSLLAVVALRGGAGDPATLTTVARSLVGVHDATFLLGPNFVCGADTLVLAFLLLRSGLVPRFIPVLGLVGGSLIFASAVAELFGLYEQVSTLGGLTAVPVFGWEICLAVHLVVKGFRPAPSPRREPAPVAVAA
jgi:hypothetical protein